MGAQAVRLSNVDIDNAIKNKDFEVLFQPIFDLGNGALARMETFVRWRHKTLGLLPPGAFISFFETQGRMSELTRYVLSAALQSYVDWRGAYAPGLSINLALSDLGDEAFVGHFQKLLRDYNFPADLVTLECPMPPVDMDADVAAGHFKALSGTGARLAIEVRGRANEFLRTVNPFPFDEIKTGGASILRFARTVRGPGLSAIADLLDIANQANAAITAVGVEDQTSLVALRGLGFTAAQGNHLGKVGALKDFMPSKVNDVRSLLKLDPLDADSLNALFRSAAPGSDAGVLTAAPNAAADQDKTQDEEGADGTNVDASENAAAQEAERKTRARDKARKLALAKRAKTREARKAAAIERVKAKTAAQSELPGLDLDEAMDADLEDDPFGPGLAPRDMQQRIAKEFAPEQEATSGPAPEKTPPPEASAAAPTPQRAKEAAEAPVSDEKVTETQAKRPAKGVVKAESSEDKSRSLQPGDAKATKNASNPEAPLKQGPAMAEKAPSAKASSKRQPPARPAASRAEPPVLDKAPEQASAKAPAPAASLIDALPPAARPQPASAQAREKTEAAPEVIKYNLRAGARFFPVIKVAGPMPDRGPATNAVLQNPGDAPAPLITDAAQPATAAAEMGDAPAKEIASAETTNADEEPALAAATSQPQETSAAANETPPLAAPARNDAAVEDDPLFGDLHRAEEESAEEEVASPVRSAPRRKNFLTRKYRLVPTHFWPRSWKRRYRMMKAKQAAKRQADDAVSVDDASSAV